MFCASPAAGSRTPTSAGTADPWPGPGGSGSVGIAAGAATTRLHPILEANTAGTWFHFLLNPQCLAERLAHRRRSKMIGRREGRERSSQGRRETGREGAEPRPGALDDRLGLFSQTPGSWRAPPCSLLLHPLASTPPAPHPCWSSRHPALVIPLHPESMQVQGSRGHSGWRLRRPQDCPRPSPETTHLSKVPGTLNLSGNA